MCGIAGFFHFDKERPASRKILGSMTDCLSHRGPDGDGFYCQDNVALGHRRLSIIDLSTGDQPMFSDDGNIVVIFNGEIYNYIELREELRTLGHSFKTTSDTEVIIKSWQQWGVDCQNKFNGMWAIALWDKKQQRLFLSRDRLGEKPLFYSVYDNTLVFGSEIKSLLTFGCPATPNLEVTELYLSLSFVPAPYTFYKSISKLPAGHYLLATPSGHSINQYWDFPKIDERNMISDKRFVYQNFEELFMDAVRIRMRSDVPFGAFLSGGLDSSSIVACMSRLSKTPVQTFTIGFKEKAFDERKLALDSAIKFKTDHHEQVVEPDSFEESLRKIAYQFDEPFGDSSAIPTGYVSKAAVKNVKMVLTGDGGDEVLSGYVPYQGEKFAEQYQSVPRFIRAMLPGMADIGGKLFRGDIRYKFNRAGMVLRNSEMSFDERLLSKFWSSPDKTRRLITSGVKQHKITDFVYDFYSRYPLKDPFYKLMVWHTMVVLPDDYLTKVDRMSMAHSLETRVPFLDYRLVEFMATVHKDIKMEGYTRKSVLRNTIGKQLPESVMQGSKKGFGVPLREWFKNRNFEEKLQGLYSTDIGLDSSLVREMVIDNTSGKRDLGNFLWMLFMYKDFIDRNGKIKR